MAHKIIQLKSEYPDSYIDQLIAKDVHPNDGDYDDCLLIAEHCTVLKPNGEVLLTFLPRALNLDYATTAFNEFADYLTDAKGSARSAVSASPNSGSEGVLGFMDRVHRFNYCRATSLTSKNLEGFKAAMPFIRSAGELLKIHAPERYAAQLVACEACHPDYIIPNTPFSTLTLNRDVTVSYHTDKGDYKPGLGVIAATWAVKAGKGWKIVTDNSAKGGILVFPKFRVAVKLRSGDLVLADVHECHGVTEIYGEAGMWARLSFVFYLREKMNECGNPAEELARVSEKDTAEYVQAEKDEL